MLNGSKCFQLPFWVQEQTRTLLFCHTMAFCTLALCEPSAKAKSSSTTTYITLLLLLLLLLTLVPLLLRGVWSFGKSHASHVLGPSTSHEVFLPPGPSWTPSRVSKACSTKSREKGTSSQKWSQSHFCRIFNESSIFHKVRWLLDLLSIRIFTQLHCLGNERQTWHLMGQTTCPMPYSIMYIIIRVP